MSYSIRDISDEMHSRLCREAGSLAKPLGLDGGELLAEAALYLLKKNNRFDHPMQLYVYLLKSIRGIASDLRRQGAALKRGGYLQTEAQVEVDAAPTTKIQSDRFLEAIFRPALPLHCELEDLVNQIMDAPLEKTDISGDKSILAGQSNLEQMQDARRQTIDALMLGLAGSRKESAARLIPFIRLEADPEINNQVPQKKGKRMVTEKYGPDLDVIAQMIIDKHMGSKTNFADLVNAYLDKAIDFLADTLIRHRGMFEDDDHLVGEKVDTNENKWIASMVVREVLLRLSKENLAISKVLVLTYLYHHTTAEISVLMGVPYSRVRKLEKELEAWMKRERARLSTS